VVDAAKRAHGPCRLVLRAAVSAAHRVSVALDLDHPLAADGTSITSIATDGDGVELRLGGDLFITLEHALLKVARGQASSRLVDAHHAHRPEGVVDG